MNSAILMDLEVDVSQTNFCGFYVLADLLIPKKVTGIAVDTGVEELLRAQMALTLQSLVLCVKDGNLKEYEPSEKYDASESVFDRGSLVGELSEVIGGWSGGAEGIDVKSLSNSGSYVARFRCKDGTNVVGVRRSAQFKGVGHRLINLLSDSLKPITTPVFRLDSEFDFVLIKGSAYVLHVAGFTQLLALSERLKTEAKASLEELEQKIQFVDFKNCYEVARTSTRAAALVASVKKRDLSAIQETKLRRDCTATKVQVDTTSEKLAPTAEGVIGLLELLDRRRYTVDLTDSLPEVYSAPSRTRVSD